MAWTQQNVDDLKKAMALGVKQVMQNGEMVQYNSVAEMKDVLRLMENEVAAQSGNARTGLKAFGVTYVEPSRGV